MKCVHIATLHRRHDARILIKECTSLSEAGFDVTLIVGDGEGDEDVRGVKIVDVGLPQGRIASRLVPMWRATRRARALSPNLIHFHDGLFLPFALLLALSGRRVIYDVHEDYPRQVLNWRFAFPVRYAVSFCYSMFERAGGFLFSRIVAATPHISSRFPERKTVTVQNFPVEDELGVATFIPHAERPPKFAYVGGISAHRGIGEMIEAMKTLACEEATLELAGSFSPASLQREVEGRSGWGRVRFRNWLSREDVANLLGRARAGLVLFHAGPNHTHAQPNKLFEYMSVGLPVIASDFPLWRRIVEGAGCGLLVDPLDPKAIANAMAWILDNPTEAEAMGRRGRQAVIDTYNWDREAEKLLECYHELDAREPKRNSQCA